MKRKTEEIRKEMEKRGVKPSNNHDLVFWGILFALEDLREGFQQVLFS